jgi:Na+/proline symporter
MNGTFYGILAYIVLSLVIGLWVSRRVSTEADYLVAGRSLGYVLATFSVFATWFGAETCIGASAAVYEHGLAGVRADPFGYTLCLVLMGVIYAVPLWNRGLTTMADLFRQRYSVHVERLAAFILFPSSVVWAAAQIRAFGHVLSASSSFQLEASITLAASIVIIYTVSGGLLADAVTDVIQGVALITGLVVLAIVMAISDPVGPPTGLSLPAAKGIQEGWLDRIDAWAIPIFGSVIAQELVARVIATRSAKVARRATLSAAALYLLMGTIPLSVGLAGVQLFPQVGDPEQVMSLVAQHYLPPILYVIYAGALVSAILSTVDSALLAASALLSHNVVVSLVPSMRDRQKLMLARAGVVVLGLIAYVLAIYGRRTYEMVEMASSMGSAGILVVLTFGLFTRLGGQASALAALAAGVIVWYVAGYVVVLPGSFVISIAAAAACYLIAAIPVGKLRALR